MESEERVENFSSQNFDFYFQILDNALLNAGKVPVFKYVHRRCIFWIVRYDDVRVRYRQLNCLQNRAILPVVTLLWFRITLASANEQKLLKIDL